MKKYLKICLAIVLSVAFLCQTAFSAFAASNKTEYVGEVILSYGKTPEEAKKWLTDNGYQYVDRNLNEGADDTIFLSKERAVYLGYKTTTDPDKAITDMKLMNMNGGYSIQDYQMVIEEEKSNIKIFVNQFITALGEYRTNYKNGSPRAKSAYNMLNMITDDDTGMQLGDLLLNKIKEEYSSDVFTALSETEKKKHADLTTILMQGNAEIVLYIEQILSMATDTNDTLWLDRLADTPDYDTMLQQIIDEENVDPAKAEKSLSAKYDDDAKILGSKVESYREWLKDYSSAEVKFTDTEKQVTDYCNKMDDTQKALYSAKGAQYEILNGLQYDDDNTLLDLFISDEYDLTGEDSYMLYPVVATLSDGQRSCLDFVSLYQLVSMGCNTDDVVTDLLKEFDFGASEKGEVSVYSGVDRSIYGNDVALTGDAYKLQTSSDKDYSTNWFTDGISDTAVVLGVLSIATIGITVMAFTTSAILNSKYYKIADEVFTKSHDYLYNYMVLGGPDPDALRLANFPNEIKMGNECFYWSNIFSKVGFCLTVVSIIISGVTLWYAYEDLKKYYNTDFTPIPLWMVDQGVDENNEKTFTYYKAVSCNRIEGNFTADNTKLLKDFGDLNGDVGKQWLALYTTTDKSAGDPIIAEFVTQVGKANVPVDFTALSLFGSKSAQNLTDKKSGFTYNDDLGGIYLFYKTDSSLFTGSAVTTGIYAAIAVGVVVIGIGAIVLIRRNKKKKLSCEISE